MSDRNYGYSTKNNDDKKSRKNLKKTFLLIGLSFLLATLTVLIINL